MKHKTKTRFEFKLFFSIALILTIIFSLQILSITNMQQKKEELEFTYIPRAVEPIAYVQAKIPPVKYKASVDKSPKYVLYQTPNVNSEFKAYMDYRTITDKTSKQYELQQHSTTDDNGLRKYEDYFLVAMGTFYSDTVGDKFKITLEDEVTFDVMIGDIKKDCDTDDNNQYAPVYKTSGEFVGANIVEFIVDDEILHSNVRKLGTISYYDEFKGNVVKIEQIL